MADESSLRFIGLSLSAVTAAVTLIAVMLVVNVDRSAFERSATTAAVVASAGGSGDPQPSHLAGTQKAPMR